MSDVWFSSIFEDELHESKDEVALSDLSYYKESQDHKDSLIQSPQEMAEGDENRKFLENFSSWRSDISGLVDTDAEVSSYFEALQEVNNKITLDNSNPPELQMETTQDFILDMDSNMCRPGEEEDFDTAPTEKECESIYQELLLGHKDDGSSAPKITRNPSALSSRNYPRRRISNNTSKKLGNNTITTPCKLLSTISSPPSPPASSSSSSSRKKKTKTDSKTVKLPEEEKKSSSKTLKPVTGCLMPLIYYNKFTKILQPTIRILRLRLPLNPTIASASTSTTGDKKRKKVLKDEKRKCSYWKSLLDKEHCPTLSSVSKSKVKRSTANTTIKSCSRQKRKVAEETCKKMKKVKAVKSTNNNSNSKISSLRPR